MSLVYIDGFDWVEDQVVAFGGAGRWTSTSGVTTRFDRIIDTASGAGAAARIQASVDLIHVVPSSVTYFVGVRFRISATPTGDTPILKFNNASTTEVGLFLNSSGNFSFYRGVVGNVLGTGTYSMPIDTWVYLEAKVTVNDTTGTVELRINGSPTPDIDLSSQDTHHSGDTDITAIVLDCASSGDYDFDDLYIADAADSQDFLGDVAVETIQADGAGTDADFTPSAGNNQDNVDELPSDDDTTYNESSTVNHRDRFTYGNVTAGTILGVQAGIWAKKTAVGDREVRNLAHDGTTEGEGAAHALGTDWQWFVDMFEDHPTGAAAWTDTEVNGGEFGYTVES